MFLLKRLEHLLQLVVQVLAQRAPQARLLAAFLQRQSLVA
jgi:hypothetical protein